MCTARQMMLLCWFHPHTVTCLCPMGSGLQASLHDSLFDAQIHFVLPCFGDAIAYHIWLNLCVLRVYVFVATYMDRFFGHSAFLMPVAVRTLLHRSVLVQTKVVDCACGRQNLMATAIMSPSN